VLTAEPEPAGFDPDWLALREPADRDARAAALLGPLRRALPTGPLVVHDLGSGTGSMTRWLAPQLPGPQRWVLHDHDPGLLAAAERGCAALRAADGHPVEVGVRSTDLSRLTAADLAGATLLTASALLDLLTAAEVDALAAATAATGCPALLTLSVAGHVELDPPDEHDPLIAAAFDAHQRRTVDGRRLLGPDAPAAVAAALQRHGLHTRTAGSPWRLGPDHAELTARWLRGWVSAAVQQDPALRPVAAGYLRRRLDAGARAVVWHRDLLALPAGSEIRTPDAAAVPA
jgi:hypothetical protein